MSANKKIIIHLNAGTSKRVIDFVEQNYPKTQIGWESLGDYTTLVIQNMSNEEIDAFKTRLFQIYPIEIETILLKTV